MIDEKTSNPQVRTYAEVIVSTLKILGHLEGEKGLYIRTLFILIKPRMSARLVDSGIYEHSMSRRPRQ